VPVTRSVFRGGSTADAFFDLRLGMDLTEAQWLAVEPYLPAAERRTTPGRKGGRPFRPARDVLNGILWVLRTGAPWADLPGRYPPYQTCHRRFQTWVKAGVLPKVLKALRRDLEERGGIEDVEGFIDGTYVPAKKGGPASGGAVPARRPRSWQLQTAMVFHSLSLLREETDSTVCSPSELSTLLSYERSRLD
jgi:transposase